MTLAHDLLLLLPDDDLADPAGAARLDLALAGAVVVDLATAGRVAVAGPGESVRAGRLVVRSADPTGEPVLDDALRRIRDTSPKKPRAVLSLLADGLRERVRADLAAHEAPRAALRHVMLEGRTPTSHEVALICLLRCVDRVPAALGDLGVPAREVHLRARAVVDGGFGDALTGRSVNAVIAATRAAAADVT